MSARLIVLSTVTAAFGVISALALMDVGYLGIIEPLLRSWGGLQALVDLVILAVLVCIWMERDARERGLPAWPFLVLTLVAGSFGPLAYLLVREWRDASAPASRAGEVR